MAGMRHKVAELEGALLDAAVAIADQVDWQGTTGEYVYPGGQGSSFSPSRDWTIAGPIIERERIAVMFYEDAPHYGGPWLAVILNGHQTYDPGIGAPDGEGPTPLIAAMRAYVASKLGEEVDLPG
jgi:hypothetical protein